MAIARRREHPSHQVLVDDIVRLGGARTLAVLDVGVLSTVTVERLQGAGLDTSRYVGLDVSLTILLDARSRHPELPWVQGSAERLPFADGAFDVVVARHVLEHLATPNRALAEFARVTRVAALVCFFLPPTEAEHLQTDVYGNGFIHHNTWERSEIEKTMRSLFDEVSSQVVPDQHRPNEIYRLLKTAPLATRRPPEAGENR